MKKPVMSPEVANMRLIWRGMIKRCHDPKHRAYRNYGGRGITVCDAWRNNFGRFVFDMGLRPAGLSLERIDNEAGYSKSNCTWVTPKEQCINRRSTVFLKYVGQRLSISDWSRLTGLNITTIHSRITKGWTPAEALTTPTHPKRLGFAVSRRHKTPSSCEVTL